MQPRDYQERCLASIFDAWRTHRTVAAVLATGLGKCLGKDTPILMFDGTIRPVQNIVIGDLLMGPDSRPREVLSTVSGTGDLFKVIPTKGDPFICNAPHLLAVKRTNQGGRRQSQAGHKRTIRADQWNAQNKTFRHIYKAYRVGVDFPEYQWLHLDPYFLGLWLGDGTSRSTQITTADPEIKEYLQSISQEAGLRLAEVPQPGNQSSRYAMTSNWARTNKFHNGLKALHLLQNKHIPACYKRNSRWVRLQVLAGLIDSDGSLVGEVNYDFTSMHKHLADDVAFLARSLGMAAYVKSSVKRCQTGGGGTYWRVSISGNTFEIPVKIKRKQANPRKQKKDVLVTGIKVEPIGIGAYYGFEITEDRLFLLGDFTVTHNTIIFAHVLARRYEETRKRTLVIAHRKELIDQAKTKIGQVTDLKCAIEMGWQRVEEDMFRQSPVVIASVQSLNSGDRLKKFKPEDFGLIVVDEFHHGTSATYRRVFEHFSVNPDLRILGVTATIDRADEESISQVCDFQCFTYDILDGINDGWLVPITQQFCQVSSLDVSHVRTTAGDLNKGDLEKIMEAEETVQGVCQPAIEVLYGLEPKTLSQFPVARWGEFIADLGRTPRRSIVFTVSVAQAEACCSIFNRVIPGIAEWVCGKTPTDDREAILARFASGKTAVVANCGVLLEGFDQPAVEVIFMARPTKSRSLYTQAIGRSTRPLPGIVDGLTGPEARKLAICNSPKKLARIIDFVGNSGRHRLVCAFDILSGKKSLEAVEAAIAKAKAEGRPVTVTKQLTNAELTLEQQRKERIRLAEEARKKKVVAKVDYDVTQVDPFGRHRQERNWDNGHMPRRSKDGKLFSDKQLHYLRESGITNPSGINYKQGQAIIGKVIGQPSRPQAEWLRKHGYTPEHFDRRSASLIMDAWAKNDWRRPANEADLLST